MSETCAKCGHEKEWHGYEDICAVSDCPCKKFELSQGMTQEVSQNHSPQETHIIGSNGGQTDLEDKKPEIAVKTSGFDNHSPKTDINSEGNANPSKSEDGSDDESLSVEKKRKKYFADASRKYAHKNKDKIREKAKRVYHEDKTKQLARANTNNRNEKTGFCVDCKEEGKTEFHHIDYVPNIFIEVCKRCHNVRHGRNYYGE